MRNGLQAQKARSLALVLSAVLGTVSLYGGNLLVDPGFESQTPAAQGGWFPFNGAYFSTGIAHTGQWSLFAPAFFSVPGAFEQFPAAPGSKWRLTGYGLTPSQLFESFAGSPAFGIVQVSFFDIFGNNLGTVETAGNSVPAKTSNPIDITTPPFQWQFLNTGIATAPPGTAFIQAFPLYVDFSGFFQGVYFDDLDLEVLGVTHGQYVSSITQNATALQNAGYITAAQAELMITNASQSAAGKGVVPNPTTLAFDNADWGSYYSPQPNPGWPVVNGGFGYGPWTMLNDIALGTGQDGGTYMSGAYVEWRQVDGDWSFGLYAYGTGFDISRPLSAPVASGRFSILTRFDLAGVGHNFISLRSGNSTSAFNAGELLAFGINGDVDQAQLSYTDATGTHLLPSGEARGLVWHWTVDFNAAAGTYLASVTDVDGFSGYSATFSGTLEPNGNSVGSFAALNGCIGSFQNLIFDSPAFCTPLAVSSTTATPSSLSPNGGMVPVTITVTTPDAQGQPAASKIVNVTCNQPVGPTDIVLTGDLTLNLRAQSLSTGSGRVYTITVLTTDLASSAVNSTATVTVPHS